MAKENKPVGPTTHHGSTQVTVAFPFSNINLRANAEEIRELAAAVNDLAEQIAKLNPSPDTDALVERTQALVTKLQK